MSHLFISAAHKSSGKTLLSIGLCAAWRERGRVVQAFKKGPDYIDSMWLARASGRPCLNLDFNTMSHDEIRACVAQRTLGTDLALTEGNKGLHDGITVTGEDANAALAKLLGTPVVLTIDTCGITRGIAPLLHGYTLFDPDVHIAGVILNQVGSPRHEAKLRAAVETYTDLPVLGTVARGCLPGIAERHLGLQPPNEAERADPRIAAIGRIVADSVDLAALEAIAARAPVHTAIPAARGATITGPRPRLGIARDAAFGFYYPDDLERLRTAGAELVVIDTLHDTVLPPVDALFIGGGFPEMQLEHLEANRGLRAAIRCAIEHGMPVYAECGGLMYLARQARWGERSHEMVGALPVDVAMLQRPQGRGYVVLEETGASPWPDPPRGQIPAHEFHYSRLENYDATAFRYAYRVHRGHGIDGEADGLIYRNVLASYTHLRATERYDWTARFLAFVHARIAQRGAGSYDKGLPLPAE